jgi:hypothetical protein
MQTATNIYPPVSRRFAIPRFQGDAFQERKYVTPCAVKDTCEENEWNVNFGEVHIHRDLLQLSLLKENLPCPM